MIDVPEGQPDLAALLDAAQRAEASERFVAEATQALNATLDEAATVGTLARLAIEAFADWCAIDLVGPDGRIGVSAIEHADPELAAYARALREQYPMDPDAPIGPYAVIRSRSSQLLPEIPAAVVDEVTGGDPEQAAIVARLAIRSFMCVPLAVHDEVLGALTLVASDSGRRFTERDLRIAEEVAGRAAAALQNARLYSRVTRHAQAERARAAELDAVIASMSDGVLVCEADGTVRLRNAAATALIGDAGTYEEVCALFADAQQAPRPGTVSGPVAARLFGDPGRWLEVSSSPVAGVDAAEWVVILRDVTARRQAELVRDTFIDVLSHELRTPVTSIYVAADLLAKAGPPADPVAAPDGTRTADLVRDIRAEAERLRLLVEDVVALTRFGDTPATDRTLAEPVLVERVAARCITEAGGRFPGVQFRLRASGPLPPASADAAYVEHVLRNILGNAAKFGGAGTTVEVVVDLEVPDATAAANRTAAPRGTAAPDAAAPAPAPAIVTRVLDDGPGFPAGDAARIFERFYRSPSTARRASGSGIGLFVAARLVQAMGGRIWAAGRPDGGAEVGFSLPLVES